MAVVAHELGHAQQDKEGYFWLQLRSGLVGVANIGSQLGVLLIFVGLLLAGMSARSGGGLGISLAYGGIMLMAAAVAFTLITLPVELNASARARAMLARSELVTPQEAEGVSAMLNAAALTYVAAAAQAVMQLLYFITLVSGRDRALVLGRRTHGRRDQTQAAVRAVEPGVERAGGPSGAVYH